VFRQIFSEKLKIPSSAGSNTDIWNLVPLTIIPRKCYIPLRLFILFLNWILCWYHLFLVIWTMPAEDTRPNGLGQGRR